jgi:folate-dependent phosphoribosylglycinamide formyltransferase PurN
VPVLTGDDEPTLAARVLAVEHRLYPQALASVARGDVTMADDKAIWRTPQRAAFEAFSPGD